MVLMRNLRFGPKALLISLAFLLPMLAAIGWLLLGQTQHAFADRQNATRQHVEVAHSVLVWAHGLETSGKASRGEAQDLAGAVVFLSSSASNYVNGHTLAVDGGWLGR